MSNKAALIQYRDGSVDVAIVAVGNVFELQWNDYVANEWSEAYEELSVAIARLATLIHCGEADWIPGFAVGPAEFETAARAFHRSVTE